MGTHSAYTPAIIDDYFIFDRAIIIKPSDELFRVPVFGFSFPVSVGPNDAWFVFIDLYKNFIIKIMLITSADRELQFRIVQAWF